MLRYLFQTCKDKGVKGTLRFLWRKYFPKKAKPIRDFKVFLQYFDGKKGIEIGGPSPIFSKEVPVYQVIDSLDGCNFSNQTVWEGKINAGNNYNYFKDKKGFQYICEASDLSEVPIDTYDFLMASHCLEHCANTFRTFEEWTRVVKKGGALLLVLPDRRFTFDHNRSVTTFAHLEEDLRNDIDETDLTHLQEIVALHDLSLDAPAGTKFEFEKRSLDNFHNRCLHHHVFDFELLEKIYERYDMKVVRTVFVKPYHQIILGVKQ